MNKKSKVRSYSKLNNSRQLIGQFKPFTRGLLSTISAKKAKLLDKQLEITGSEKKP